MIYIHKGDDTDFNDSSFLRFELETDWDLTGWKAIFVLDSIVKEIDDISSKSFDVHLSSKETKNLPCKVLTNELKLMDEDGKIKTIAKDIKISVTNEIVLNKTQVINLPLLKDEGIDVNVKVIQVPTKTSDLINDDNFLSAIVSDPKENDVITFDGEKWINKVNQHEIGSITNLQETLDGKANKTEIPSLEGYATENYVAQEIDKIPDVDLSDYVTNTELENKGYLTQHQDISNLATKDELNDKQDVLVSGTNIKTINNQSILGDGNITIEGGEISEDIISSNSSLIARYAMPADRAITLTVGATGDKYTAPANGYFIFQALTNRSNYVSTISLTAEIEGILMDGSLTSRGFGYASQIWIYSWVPVRAGQTVYTRYDNIQSSNAILRFIYAEGEQ